MICSLNEIEAMSRKAARGGGLSWGLAEEAGKAVRWLCDNGLPGARLLADLLLLNDGKAYSDLVPQQVEGVWSAQRGSLCPIIAGAMICDRAEDMLKNGEVLRLGETSVPMLLAPFVSETARAAGIAITIEWQGARIVLDGQAIQTDGDEAALLTTGATSLTMGRCDEHPGQAVFSDVGRHVSVETMEILDRFAQRTYAPATDESRAGAGAGRDDD